MRRRLVAALALLTPAALLACAGNTSAPSGEATPRKVVVLAPAAAEMLESLGLLDRVVAVGEFGPWPPAIADLPVAGGYASPNVEVVLSLGADAVVTAESAAASDAHRKLEQLGVPVVALDTGTFEGVFASLLRLGGLFQRDDQARRIERALRGELREIERAAVDLPRRRVLFVVGRDPLYVAGPGSHVDRMIALAGGENVAADATSPYQQLSLEAVLERAPEIIVDTSDNGPAALRGRRPGGWARWTFLPAVEADRVYQVDPSQLVIPGVRLPSMTGLMAQLIHPEVFGEPQPNRYGPLTPATERERHAATP